MGGAIEIVQHPSRPVVAYTSGCMIIIYDMLTDQKINLVRHEHEVHALAFTSHITPNSQLASGTSGEFILSIDFNRNDPHSQNGTSVTKMCLWNW